MFRTFLPVLTLAILVCSVRAADWPYQDATPGAKIIYVQPDASLIPLKPYAGQTYEDLIPDSLDLAQMAALTINVLTSATNPNQDYEQYFSVFIGNPWRMANNFSDWCTPKYMEALPLLRLASGSRQNLQVDQAWLDVNRKSQGPDGLYYLPLEGKPWYGRELWWAHGIARADGSVFTMEAPPSKEAVNDIDVYGASHANPIVQQSGIRQFSHPQACGRMLNVYMGYYARDGRAEWRETARNMVDRLNELLIEREDYGWFPAYYVEPNAQYDKKSPLAELPSDVQGGEINGRLGEGAARVYRATGHRPALELARKLSRFVRYHMDYFGANGEFTGNRHFHSHTIYLLNLLEYATAADDKEMLDFVRKSFEWGRTPAAGGSTLLGWFPEWARPGFPTCEGCSQGDMIALALRLSQAGAGNYYADAERWTRNHFAEAQLTWAKAQFLVRKGQSMPGRKILYNETTSGVPERNLGGFAGWSLPNDWWSREDTREWGGYENTENLIMHCCTGNCSRTVYRVWESILDHEDGQLRVNMLLNRASPWADVYSFVPYLGRVDVKLKQDCRRLSLHVPEWVETGSKAVTLEMGGKPVPLQWEGRYVSASDLSAGAVISLRFPLAERTVEEQIAGKKYAITLRGNTVVHIDPPGSNAPLYLREHYRQEQVPWLKVTRFVSDENLRW